jgi:hypothetical protein
MANGLEGTSLYEVPGFMQHVEDPRQTWNVLVARALFELDPKSVGDQEDGSFRSVPAPVEDLADLIVETSHDPGSNPDNIFNVVSNGNGSVEFYDPKSAVESKDWEEPFDDSPQEHPTDDFSYFAKHYNESSREVLEICSVVAGYMLAIMEPSSRENVVGDSIKHHDVAVAVVEKLKALGQRSE